MKTYKVNCHPRKSKKSKTCFDDSDLHYLRDEWNRKNPTKKIKGNRPDLIHKQLKKYQQQCKNELCWLKMVEDASMKQKIIQKDFATFHPKNWRMNENEWLSNFDISRVLKQYKEAHSDFDFIDPSPIDFDTMVNKKCVTEEICNFDIQSYLKRGITKIAIPLNLDKHTGNGFHWVTLFIDLKRKFIYYFDSANNKIPDEVSVFIKRIKEQTNLRELNNQSVQHQKGSTECGMYVLYFIISMLEGKSPTYFNRKIIRDNEVFKFRRIYFNSEE
jgi:Ulp1 family protease